METSEPELNKATHIKYWQRCLKSLLPTDYTGNDSTRVALAYFILSALDLLGAGPETFGEEEREGIKKWFLSCQVRSGGFCGSPGLIVDGGKSCDADAKLNGNGKERNKSDVYDPLAPTKPWLEPANLLTTYFAILGLALVGGLEEIRREDCLRWLKRLQRKDGGFGEGEGWGGRDCRGTYCGVVTRWLLCGGEVDGEEDIDVEGLVGYLRGSETYDGGISHGGFPESHGGYTYCALASLSLLNRLPPLPNSTKPPNPTQNNKPPGLTNINATIRWLVARQQPYITIDGDDESSTDEDEEKLKEQEMREKLVGVFDEHKNEKKNKEDVEPLIPQTLDECYYVGQNGRCNKPADTCYSFWNCGALDLLGQSRFINRTQIRRFLLEQTEHRIGGFGKFPGSPPDIYHSFLGLAALSTMKEPNLKDLDTELCVSMDLRNKINAFRENLLSGATKSKGEMKGKGGPSMFELFDGMVKGGGDGEMEKEKRGCWLRLGD